MLILTDEPRLFYYKPKSLNQVKNIDIAGDSRVERIDKLKFQIVTLDSDDSKRTREYVVKCHDSSEAE